VQIHTFAENPHQGKVQGEVGLSTAGGSSLEPIKETRELPVSTSGISMYMLSGSISGRAPAQAEETVVFPTHEHRLVRKKNAYGIGKQYSCDACMKTLLESFHCGACSFDVCIHCASKYDPT